MTPPSRARDERRDLRRILHAVRLHARRYIHRPGTDVRDRLARRSRASGRRQARTGISRATAAATSQSPRVPVPRLGSSRQASAAPASMHASRSPPRRPPARGRHLDHLPVSQQRNRDHDSPPLSWMRSTPHSSAMRVHGLDVLIGEDADGERALPLQQPLQRLAPPGGTRPRRSRRARMQRRRIVLSQRPAGACPSRARSRRLLGRYAARGCRRRRGR